MRKDVQLLRQSGAFDESWYRAEYGDVHPRIDAAEHFLRIGAKLGRRPGPEAPSELLGGIGNEKRIVDAITKIANDTPSRPGFVGGTDLGLISVIVPVHNAKDDASHCLESVAANSFPVNQLIVVDDGSQSDTAEWLAEFAERHANVKLIRHDQALGYTRAVNAGAAAAAGEALVILNSDTIVPPFWLERLCTPLWRDPGVDAAGPLSNAASWQSVPLVKDERGWAVNDLPVGWTVEDFDRLVQQCAVGTKPGEVELLNGFCYAIRQSTFECLGGLDGEAFPSGYGEETDLFLRLRELGRKAVVVPDLFVFHAKSKSFGAERRKALSAAGNDVLYARYGRDTIMEAAGSLQDSEILAKMRARLTHRLTDEQAVSGNSTRRSYRIAFLLPVRPGGGGVHSVVQEAEGLAGLGNQTKVIVPLSKLSDYKYFYPRPYEEGMFIPFANEADLLASAEAADVIVATHYRSVRLLEPVYRRHSEKLFMYYVQDYEPWITEPGSGDYDDAGMSYTLLPNMVLMAKTHWICRMVHERHGVPVYKIAPSIEHEIYNTHDRVEGEAGPLRVAAMLRPRTPRRGARKTLEVLTRLSAQRDIEVITFGCSDADLESLLGDFDQLAIDNKGVLVREQVANILRTTDIFLDISVYQAFGRTALEAVACGASAIVPALGGTQEYALNPMIRATDTSSVDAVISAVEDMITFRATNANSAEWVAHCFTTKKASRSISNLIRARI